MASYNLGLLLEENEDINGAVEAFERCLRSDCNYADARSCSILDELLEGSESE